MIPRGGVEGIPPAGFLRLVTCGALFNGRREVDAAYGRALAEPRLAVAGDRDPIRLCDRALVAVDCLPPWNWRSQLLTTYISVAPEEPCGSTCRLAEWGYSASSPRFAGRYKDATTRQMDVASADCAPHFPFKVSRKAIAFWRIGFSLIAMNARTSAAPSRVPRNETMSFSDSEPSCGAGCFFPTAGAPSKK